MSGRIAGRLADLSQAARQRRFPPEFRIPRHVWPDDVLDRLERLPALAPAPDVPDVPAFPVREAEGSLDRKALAAAVTSLWRAERKLPPEDTDGLPRQVRQALRHVEAAWDVFREAGVEVVDHAGTPFDSGLAIEVIAFQPTPGLEREWVIEVIRPTIYLENERIQIGQVVVGTPQEESSS